MEVSSPPASPTANGEAAPGALPGPAKALSTRRCELELLLNSDPVPPPLSLPLVDDDLPDGGSPRTDSNCNLFAVKVSTLETPVLVRSPKISNTALG
jgi:hypothetical protein